MNRGGGEVAAVGGSQKPVDYSFCQYRKSTALYRLNSTRDYGQIEVNCDGEIVTQTKESSMNLSLAFRYGMNIAADAVVAIGKRWMMIGAVAFVITVPAIAQNAALQEKVAAVKQAAAENKQRLQQYQWTETQQLTLKGDEKPPTQNLCRYGPDGTVQKTELGPPPQQPSGGRLKQHVIAKKTEEMKDYMQDVKVLLSMYVPPDPMKMQQAYQAGKVSFNPAGGLVNLIFKDYAQPGDEMTLSFDTAQKKITTLNINTYMGQSKDVVTLQVQMATLPNGINYSQQTVLNAAAKQLVVTTTSSNYQSLGN